MLTWIADELDGELLDRLHGEWLHAKGWRRRETQQEGAWAGEWKSDMGRLVRWHEAFPDSRQDMYRIDGSVSLALDHYCINPSCTCREVRVGLLAPGRSRGWTQFGDILLDLDSLNAFAEEGSRDKRDREREQKNRHVRLEVHGPKKTFPEGRLKTSVPPHFAMKRPGTPPAAGRHQALGVELTSEAGTTRSNDKAHARFALPPRGARQTRRNADAARVAAGCTRNSTLSKCR